VAALFDRQNIGGLNSRLSPIIYSKTIFNQHIKIFLTYDKIKIEDGLIFLTISAKAVEWKEMVDEDLTPVHHSKLKTIFWLLAKLFRKQKRKKKISQAKCGENINCTYFFATFLHQRKRKGRKNSRFPFQKENHLSVLIVRKLLCFVFSFSKGTKKTLHSEVFKKVNV
jgi:hypothetical protein